MTAAKRRLNLKTVRAHISRFFATYLTKKQLRLLARGISAVTKYLWQFLQRHRHLTEGILCGVLAAAVLVHLHWIGQASAIIAISAGAFVGMVRELMGQLDEAFTERTA